MADLTPNIVTGTAPAAAPTETGTASEVSEASFENSLLETTISIVACSRATTTHDIKLGAVIAGIKTGTWREEIEPIRAAHAAGDSDTVAKLKKDRLPGILFSGRFSRRANDAVVQRSKLTCADIDDPGEPIDALAAKLGTDPHVVLVFRSPTGRGLKVVLRCDPNRPQIESFWAAERHLASHYGVPVDQACKDVARMCFVSWDPHLIENPDAVPLTYEDLPQRAVAQGNGLDLRSDAPKTDANQMRDLLRCIPPRPPYPDWLKIASAVWSVLPKEEGCEVLREWSPEEQPGEYEAKWQHRLDRITVGTLYFFAGQHEWQPPKKAALVASTADAHALEGDEFVDWCARSDQRGDAVLFARLGRGKYLYDCTAKTWLIYRDGVWASDQTRQTRRHAVELIASKYLERATRLDEEIATEPPTAETPADAKGDHRVAMRNTLRRKAALLNKRKQIDDVLHLARDLCGVRTVDFDLKPAVLNLSNGTFDCATCTFHKHSWSDMLTRQAQVEFQSDAKCPHWETFIKTICGGDPELAAFIQRALACSVAGKVSANAVHFCYGSGRNGKTTLFTVIKNLLGDYFAPLTIETLLTQFRGGRDSIAMAELVRLRAARIAWASEIPEGRRLNEALVKDLSGGDVITARALYENPFQFMPSHTLWLAGNHQPEIRGVDEGIWRRIHMIPFAHQFPKHGEPGYREFDEVVAELLAEAPGILNWLIAGMHDLRAHGLNPPAAVRAATEDYRHDSDILKEFIEARCVVEPRATVVTSELWFAYLEHCEGERPAFTRRTFAFALQRRGFRLGRTNAARLVEGLRLRNVSDACAIQTDP